MHLLRFISLLLAALFVGCSPSADSGLTKQEMEDIANVVMKQTTNHLVGMQREPNGDVTVWTAPLRAGTNGVGISLVGHHEILIPLIAAAVIEADQIRQT